MAKKKKLNWRDLGLITVAAFAWSKLGVGEAVKDIVQAPGLPSDPCPPGMQRRLIGGRWICTVRFD